MGESGTVSMPQPPPLDVVLWGSPFLPGLSFSTTPYCSTASLSPGPALQSVQGLFWCQENAYKQAATRTVTHRSQRQTQKETKTQRRHNPKVSEGLSPLISSVIALSCTANPLVWWHSNYPKKKAKPKPGINIQAQGYSRELNQM